MIPNTLDLNLAIAHAYIVAWSIDRCGAGKHSSITHRETRAMPWTFHDIACQRSLIQWAACMRTCCCNGTELQTLAQQDDRNASGCHTIQLVFLNALHRQHSLVVFTRSLPGSMVDTGAFGEDHVAAKIACNEHRNKAEEAE